MPDHLSAQASSTGISHSIVFRICRDFEIGDFPDGIGRSLGRLISFDPNAVCKKLKSKKPYLPTADPFLYPGYENGTEFETILIFLFFACFLRTDTCIAFFEYQIWDMPI